jgi:hypothetical protein
MTGKKTVAYLSLIILFIFTTCIDPYTPRLTGYESLLVVEGLVTNENSSYSVRLSRTFQEQNTTPVIVSDATVSVKDDIGNEHFLKYSGSGIYKSDSLAFRGVTGRSYVLHILTNDKDEYESEPCLMQSVPGIDSIYFAKEQVLINSGTESQDGVQIYLDSKSSDNNLFYRWTYTETWKFKVPNPKLFDYIHNPDKPNAPLITPVEDIKETGWKNHQSDEILVKSISEQHTDRIVKQPVEFIAPDISDRLILQYSILIKQYSISKKEYDFWNNLKQVTETGGDIFAKQPYAVISNIHSLKNPGERVLGFFQISAVTQKRKNIAHRDVALMGLHFYSYPCKTWQFKPGDFDTRCMCPPKTWDDVYWYLSIASDYTFVRPIYQGLGDSILMELEFTRPECANSELTGTRKKPDYWDEFN